MSNTTSIEGIYKGQAPLETSSYNTLLSLELADDEKQRLMKDKQMLRDEWQEQADAKQKQVI
jgi:hypothetical protein